MFARSYGQTPGINPNQGPQSVEGLGGQFGGFGGGLGFNGGLSQNDLPQQFPAPSQPMNNMRPQAQRPNQNRYDKFAEAMMNARGGRRGGMGKPMGPRHGMSPPLIPGGSQPMIGHIQSIAGQMQAKPAMQPMQPGAPILTNGPGIY